MNANNMRRILVVCVSLFLASCTGMGSWIQRPGCSVVPVPTGDLPDDIGLRAHLRFSMEGREAYFEVIARRAAEELVVVGIAQYGVRLFAARQRDREITLEGALSRESARLARWTLDALHRALWISPPSDAGAGPGVSWNWEGESVTESTDGGQRMREFARPGESSSVAIRYRPPSTQAGDRVEIQNSWCGYEATLVLVDTPEQVVQ